jgi:predicted nucleic acid-binding protein
MILADTDILSALAKVGRLSLLFSLFCVTRLQIVPGVFKEIAHSVALGRSYATEILSSISSAQIEVIGLSQEETVFCDTLPSSLGVGERESIAIARERKGTLLSNESRVAHYCRQFQIPCIRLPGILRAFWIEGITSKDEVQLIVVDLQRKDKMKFKQSTLAAIFAI